MKKDLPPGPNRPSSLDVISTEWALVHDSGEFVGRYGAAIHGYLQALLKNQHDVDDVFQDFMLHFLAKGLLRPRQERGRFRDYLKKAVRNEALNFLQRKRGSKGAVVEALHLPSSDPSQLTGEQVWVQNWRKALLALVWRAMKSHQERQPGSLCYTILCLMADHPQEDSQQLAARAAASAGHPLRADAFRKQLSRSRRLFARFLWKEVAETLDHPTPELIEDELNALGLMKYVSDFLPPASSGERGA